MTYDRRGVPIPPRSTSADSSPPRFSSRRLVSTSRRSIATSPSRDGSRRSTGRSILFRTGWCGSAAWTWRPSLRRVRSWRRWRPRRTCKRATRRLPSPRRARHQQRATPQTGLAPACAGTAGAICSTECTSGTGLPLVFSKIRQTYPPTIPSARSVVENENSTASISGVYPLTSMAPNDHATSTADTGDEGALIPTAPATSIMVIGRSENANAVSNRTELPLERPSALAGVAESADR